MPLLFLLIVLSYEAQPVFSDPAMHQMSWLPVVQIQDIEVGQVSLKRDVCFY